MKTKISTLVSTDPISEKEIFAREIALKNLWLVKHGNISYGPFETEQVQSWFEFCEGEVEGFTATNLVINEFRSFEHWDIFTFNTKVSVFDEEGAFRPYRILQNGQKSQPLTFQELKALVDQNQVLLSDQVHKEGVAEWLRIYELPEFDRRENRSMSAPVESLPFVPNNELLAKAISKGAGDLKPKGSSVEELINLAFLNNDSKHLEHVRNVLSQADSSSDKQVDKKWYWGGGAIASFIVFALFLVGGQKDLPSESSPAKTTKTQTPAINNSARTVTKKYVPPTPVQRNIVRKKVTPKKSNFIRPTIRKPASVPRPRKEPRKITHFKERKEDFRDEEVREEDIDEIDLREPASQDELDRQFLDEEPEELGYDDEEYDEDSYEEEYE